MVEVLGKNMVTEVGDNVYYKDRKGCQWQGKILGNYGK